ncbi:unnamed protein product [Calicophoron daubneyi]|uniref:Uncharacterized protein n=1 Tax=Calicophoron daubneyi TaxID=300641 RepID=A0AAV2TEQ7_CALDB
MNPELFVMEVAAWDVSLTPHTGTNEIGAIVKFLNYQPFELFRGIECSKSDSKGHIFPVRRCKSALFNYDPKQLESLLATVPLYLVLARWSHNEPNGFPGPSQRLIGVVTVALKQLGLSLKRSQQITDHPKTDMVAGHFPIRNLMGHCVGEIDLKVQLMHLDGALPSNISPISQESMWMNPSMPSSSFFACSPKPVMQERPNIYAETGGRSPNPTEMQDEGIQACIGPERCLQSSAVQTTPASSPEKVQFTTNDWPVDPVPLHKSMFMSHRSVNDDWRFTNLSPELDPIGECSELAPIQPVALQFTGSSFTSGSAKYFTFPYRRERQCSQSAREGFEYNPQSPPPREKTPTNLPSPQPVDQLPVLHSLIRELQTLKDRMVHGSDTINDDDLEAVLDIISSASSGCDRRSVGKRSKSSLNVSLIGRDNRKASSLPRRQSASLDRRELLRKKSPKRERLPPPGMMVPKDRGWLRSTPLYRGPPKSRLVPRVNHAHMLRVQRSHPITISTPRKSPSKKFLAPPQLAKVPGFVRSQSALSVTVGRKTSDQPAPMPSVRKSILIQVPKAKMEQNMKTKQANKALPMPSLSPARFSALSAGQVTEHDQKEEQHKKLDRLTPTCVSTGDMLDQEVNDDRSDVTLSSGSARMSPTQVSRSKQYNPGVRSPYAEDFCDGGFTSIGPVQSNISPQTSVMHSKPVSQPRSHSASIEERLDHLNLSTHITPRDSPIGSPRAPSADASRTSLLLSFSNPREGTEKTKDAKKDRTPDQLAEIQSEATDGSEDHFNSYSDDYEDGDSADEKPHALSNRMTPLMGCEDSDDKINIASKEPSLPAEAECAGGASLDATSFTRVTAQAEPPSHAGDSDSYEAVAQPSGLAQNENNKAVDFQDLEFSQFADYSEQITDNVDDFDIEALRQRGSDDYICGGGRRAGKGARKSTK